MSDDVQQVSPQGAEQAWERLTDGPDVGAIETARVDEIGGWQVTVWAMEFVRHDPLETDMRRRMATALRAVSGVVTADEQDREVWFVTGAPSGKELTEAAARVVDELASEIRAAMPGLQKGRYRHAPLLPTHPQRHDRTFPRERRCAACGMTVCAIAVILGTSFGPWE